MKIKLPEKVILDDVIYLLDLGHYSTIKAIKQIFVYSKYSGLPIYIDYETNAAKTTAEHTPEIDPNDGEVSNVWAGGEISSFNLGLRVLTNSIFKDENNIIINVSSFKVNKIDYYSVDEQGMFLSHFCSNYRNFYCKGSELLRFTNKSPKKQKHIPVLEKREEALKQYLRTTSLNKGIDFKGTSYQEMYKAIGQPKRDDLLASLKSADPELFKGKQDNFFREQSIVRLKDGTRKHS